MPRYRNYDEYYKIQNAAEKGISEIVDDIKKQVEELNKSAQEPDVAITHIMKKKPTIPKSKTNSPNALIVIKTHDTLAGQGLCVVNAAFATKRNLHNSHLLQLTANDQQAIMNIWTGDSGFVQAGEIAIDRETREDLGIKVGHAVEIKILQGDVTNYSMIGGLETQIRELKEMVEMPLLNPEKFKQYGLKPPRGVLLHGPPGTGKTLLAKAVASETNCAFLSIDMGEILTKWVGDSEKKLRTAFREAGKQAPCILFMDEFDSIMFDRNTADKKHEIELISQMLTLIDGIDERRQIVIMAATNRLDAIDPALRRPGRFDREIRIGLPDKHGRLEILKIHSKSTPLHNDVNLEKISEGTHGYSGADLAGLVREAALYSMRRDAEFIMQQDLVSAVKNTTPGSMQKFTTTIPSTTWDDIGGMQNVKDELAEITALFLKHPMECKKFNIKPLRGLLLHGPPGTGKSLLAKALANDSQSNFIMIDNTEILSNKVGNGEKYIKRAFNTARESKPSILFFDEIDSLMTARGGLTIFTDGLVTQMLIEMDGLESETGVTVVGATNRLDAVDPALLRPGRFDKIVRIPFPDNDTIKEILRVHSRDRPMQSGIDFDEIAYQVAGFSGADIASIMDFSAKTALKRCLSDNTLEQVITQADIINAIVSIKEAVKERTPALDTA